MKPLLTYAQAAVELDVSTGTIQNYRRGGQLTAVMENGRAYVTAESVAKLKAALEIVRGKPEEVPS